MSSIGIMGSAFNPPTLGHKDLIEQASKKFDLVYLVPNFCHAQGKQMLDYNTRCHLVTVFLGDLNLNNCQLLMVEHLLDFGEPIYTYDLLNFLSQHFENDEISFIVGPDNAKPETWQTFHRYQEVEKRWPLFVGKENLNIRSSKLRSCVRAESDYAHLTTTTVSKWVKQLKLYQP